MKKLLVSMFLATSLLSPVVAHAADAATCGELYKKLGSSASDGWSNARYFAAVRWYNENC